MYGGWERETRKSVILQQLDEALDKLGLRGHLDNPAFCTGPRRSTALSTFIVRPGETDYTARKRMHAVILGLANGGVQVPPNGKKMFATYSKSGSERIIASHASWVKRAVATFGQNHLDQLDVEFSTGTCWYGSSMIASATRPSPPGIDEQGMIRDEVEGHSVWIDVMSFGKESRLGIKDLKKALDSQRR